METLPAPVYILIRTSKRPLFFAEMMKSVKAQTYKNIITIVHTDDENDDYIEGDIIIKSKREPVSSGFYNLYCNKLLESIPVDPEKPETHGWYHFIDDDDMYASNDVIEKLVLNSQKNKINVGKVKRWDNVIFPKTWKVQKTFQTECFFLHTDHRKIGRWWHKRGGDHNYSKQITDTLKINWIEDLLICKAQKGKGRGSRNDMNDPLPIKKRKRPQVQNSENEMKNNPSIRTSVVGKNKELNPLIKVIYLRRVTGRRVERGKPGEIREIPLYYAEKLLKSRKVKLYADKKADKEVKEQVDVKPNENIDKIE